MHDSIGTVASNKETGWSPLHAGGQQEGSLLSSRESMGAGAWPWSTPSGVVWSNPPSPRLPSVPVWLSPAIARLNALLRLPQNWNSYGSLPITPATVRRAVQFIARAFPLQAPAPAIVPTPGGGIQLEWHQDGLDLEIELLPDGIECSAGDRDEVVEFPLETQLDLLRLRVYLSRLN